jgi:hypothetical protein
VLGLILVFVAFAVIVALVHAIIEQNHRRGLQAWAMSRGLAVREGGGGDWMKSLPHGRQADVTVQLYGTWQGRPVIVADYWYVTSRSAGRTTRSRRTQHLAVVIAHLETAYPPVVLHSRGLGGLGLGIAQAMDPHPANLTGDPEFDNRFRIEASEPGAGGLVTAQVIEATLGARLPPWQLQGQDLVIAWPGSLKAANLDQRLNHALTLADLLDLHT